MEKIDYADFLQRNTWAHAAILRAMVESCAPDDILEKFKICGTAPLNIELLVNGVPANPTAFFDAMGAEYDEQVKNAAAQMLAERFSDASLLVDELRDELIRKINEVKP